MDETAVLNAPADVGAAAPADSGAAAPAAVETPSAPQTDEQILGLDESTAAPVEKPVEPVQKTEQPADPNAVKTPEQQAAEKLAEDGRLMPVKWRELAKSDPEFRTLFYTAKASQEKLATIEPQFTAMQTQVAAIEKTDQAFLSGDPTAIGSELKNFVGAKPESILPMLEAGDQIFKELMPQQYEERAARVLTESLKANGFDKALEVFRKAREQGEAGRELLEAQVDKFLEWAPKAGLPTTEAERLSAQKAQLDAREQAHKEADEKSYKATSENFRGDVNKEIESSIKNEIKSSVDKLLEKTAFTEELRVDMRGEIFTKTYELLGQNSKLLEPVAAAIWPKGTKDAQGNAVRGQFNDAARKVAVDTPVTYAKSVLNDVVKQVVEKYTKNFMAGAQNRDTKAMAAAARTEISGGSNAPRTPKPLSKKDAQGMTDEEILGL